MANFKMKWTSNLLFLLVIILGQSCNKTTPDAIGRLVASDEKTNGKTDDQGKISLSIVGGNNQIGAPGTVFSEALKVQLLKDGAPFVGGSISFNLSSGATGAFTNSAVNTDNSGIASTSFISGGTAGVSVITASYLGESVSFTQTIVSQSGVISKVSGDAQTGLVGSLLSNPLVVQVIDGGSGQGQSGILISFSVAAGNGRINSTSNLFTVATDGNGFASVPFQLGTLAGSNQIEASIASLPAQMVSFSATGTVSPTAPISFSKTEVALAQTSAPADGSTSVNATVQLKDQYGNTLAQTGHTVAFSVNAGSLVGSVQDLGAGLYRQTVRVPTSTAINPMQVSASVNTQALTSNPGQIQLIAGNVDLSLSTVSASSSSLIANGSATAVLTVNLKDSLGNSIGSGGETVVLTSTRGTLIGTVSDNGNGTYSQTIRAPFLAGDATVSATVGGSPLANNFNLSFIAGPVDLTQSLVIVSPGVIPPNGTSTSLVTVALKDQYGNQVASSAGTVSINSSAGSWSGAVIDNNDGTYQRQLVSSATPGIADITASLNGSSLTKQSRVYFTSGSSGPSINHSSLQILGGVSLFPADGSSTFTVRMTLRDSSNQQLNQGGSDVSFSTTAGSLLGSLVDNGNGTYDQVIRAASLSSVATISARVDGQTIVDQESASFYGDISLTQSTLSAFPEVLEADGTSESLIVLQAKDQNGILIPTGGEVSMSLSTSAGTLIGALVDNGNGTYSQNLRASASSETATVTASKDSVSFADTATVEFFISTNLAGLTISCSNINTYKNTNVVVDNGILTMNSIENTADCSSDFVFKSLILRNGAILTHSAATSTQEYGLALTADNVSVDAASSIDVSSKGYRGEGTAHFFRVQGNQLVRNTGNSNLYRGVSGTHGGEGGSYNGSKGTLPYGNLFKPFTLGASGSADANGITSGVGGGRVRITVSNSGTFTLNGSVLANGAQVSSGDRAGSGAGGSIWIETGTLQGNGTISANGGDHSHTGAGGGRVALYYANTRDAFSYPANIVGNVTAYGGSGPRDNGAAGTVFLKSPSQSFGDLLLNNGGKLSTYGRTVIPTVADSIPDGFSSQTITKTAAFQDSYAVTPSPFIGYQINPNKGLNSTITRTDDLAFQITSATASSVSISNGDFANFANGTQNYQLFIKLDHLQIMGGAQIAEGAPLLALSGDITSGNNDVAVVGGYQADKVEFDGARSISFDGLGSTDLATYSDFDIAGDLTFKDGVFEAGKLSAQNLRLDGAVVTTGELIGEQSVVLTGNLTLVNGADLRQRPTDPTTERSLEIEAGALSIDATSKISAIGAGYQALTVPGKFASLGNVQVSPLGAVVRAGGSHGGRGGVFSHAEHTNATYGSIFNPFTSGSSGMTTNPTNASYRTYAGGGIIRIDLLGGHAEVEGEINASGAGSSSNDRCGGAGGSIWLNLGSIAGMGSIVADGGLGGLSGGGGGGGGRIALYYTSATGGFSYPSNIANRLHAFGGEARGDNNDYGDGGAGTIFLKSPSQLYGDLIINNGSRGRDSHSPTYINLPRGVSDALTANTLNDANAFSEGAGAPNTNHVVGMSLSPNANENSTPSWSDNSLFKIVDQTFDTLTITGGDLSSIGSAGSTYQVVLALDNLELMNGAKLESSGPILVSSGDILSGDDSSVSINGSDQSGSVEFLGISNYVISGGALHHKVLSTSGNLTVSAGATLSSNFIAVGGDLTVDAAELSVGDSGSENHLAVTGDLNLNNGATLSSIASTLDKTYRLNVIAENVRVDATSAIDVSERGYVPDTDRLTRSVGNLNYKPFNNSSNGVSGGSHGGRGGTANSHSAFATHGNFKEPVELGGSAGRPGGGNGGGALKLEVRDTLTVDGAIRANGGGSGGGGGAGGSIWINTVDLTGTGNIEANGGLGTNYGGGGGGRIALYYSNLLGDFASTPLYLKLNSFGGSGGGVKQIGAAGSVYLKSDTQTFGDLIFDNNGKSFDVQNITELPVISTANSGSVLPSSVSVTIDNTYNELNQLKGFWLNPNTAQNGTTSIVDDLLYRNLSNDLSSITTSGGDMTAVANSGDPIKLTLALDNLEIRGNAYVDFGAQDIVVQSGDLSSGNTTNFVLKGKLRARTIDIGPADWSLGAQGDSSAITNICANNIACP